MNVLALMELIAHDSDHPSQRKSLIEQGHSLSQRNLGFRPCERTTGGQLELTVGFGPTQARLPGSGDLIKTADAGCVGGMLHEVGLGCRFRGDRAHGIDE
jgi:hypothetical protein